jgi:hypothetical protein
VGVSLVRNNFAARWSWRDWKIDRLDRSLQTRHRDVADHTARSFLYANTIDDIAEAERLAALDGG